MDYIRQGVVNVISTRNDNAFGNNNIYRGYTYINIIYEKYINKNLIRA